MIRFARMSVWLAFAVALSGGIAGGSSDAAQPEISPAEAALLSGSDRLALFALGQETGGRGSAPAAELARWTGGLHQGRWPRVISRGVRAAPILSYASNFNGGLHAGQIRLGGLDFVIDESARAKSGINAGATLNGGVSASYRTGSTLRLSAGMMGEWLVGKGLNRQQAGLAACAEHHLTGWTWLDGCAGVTRLWRNYDSDVTQQSYSLGPTTLFEAGGFTHQVNVSATRLVQDDGQQNGIQFDWLTAVPRLGALNVTAGWADEMRDQNARRQNLSLALTRPVADRPVRFRLDLDRTGGSRAFGIDRKDTVVVASVRVPLLGRLALDASVGRRNSNIDLYDETFGGLSASVIDW